MPPTKLIKQRSREVPLRSRSAMTNNKPVKRAFYVWILLATSIFVVVHQFRQTKKVARLTGTTGDANAFLPEWSLMAANDYLNEWWHQDYDAADDDETDDDNVFEDDDDDDDDSVESGEESDNGNPDEDAGMIEIDKEVQEIRSELDRYASQHGGKLDPKLMMKYQKALRRKRGYNRKKRLEKVYYDKADREEPDYVKFADQTKENRIDKIAMDRQERARLRRQNKREGRLANMAWKPPGHNTTDYTQYPILPTERKLPDMSDTRGVIFFLHVPKTGGQTIRQMNPRFRKKLERMANKKAFKRIQRSIGGDALVPAHLKPSEWELSPEAQEMETLCSERIRFVVANTLDVFHQHAVPQVNAIFDGKDNAPGKILFVEVHGMDNYHTLELEPFLHHWREQSKKTNIPFFAFTLLREAMSLQVSFFNYYYIHPGDPRMCVNPLKPQQKCGQRGRGRFGRFRERIERMRERDYGKPGHGPGGRKDRKRLSREDIMGMDHRDRWEMMDPRERMKKKKTHENGMTDMTHEQLEEAVLKVAYDNPQCLFLARGERTFGDDNNQAELRKGLDRNECQNVYMSLQRTMDWIGTTDKLNTETLPLLANIMFKRPDLGPHMPKANVSPHDGGWLKLSKTSQATLKALDKKSQLDHELYHRVVQDYTMDQWDRSSAVQ